MTIEKEIGKMKDKQGREYARLSKLKVGDMVEVDGDFDCMRPGSRHMVQRDEDDGDLYISCDAESHKLDGQVSDGDGDSLIGIYPVA